MNIAMPPGLRTSIQDYIATLKRQAVSGSLSTYLICDPTEKDVLHGLPFGVPFYVGQGDFMSRVGKHLKGNSGRPTRKRITAIYERGKYPLFIVVDQAHTRLTSLKSEMDWACYLVGLGYSLTNGWGEHKCAKPLQSVPAKRVWQFTVKEALADSISLRVQCRACRLRLSLPLDDKSWGDITHTHLNQVRNSFTCPECSAPRCLRIDVPVVKAPSVPDLGSMLESWRKDSGYSLAHQRLEAT